MAKPWAEVANSPDFQALQPAQQEAARQQYFDQVVAPKVPQQDLRAARSQFDEQTTITQPQKDSVSAAPTPHTDGDLSIDDVLKSSVAEFNKASDNLGEIGKSLFMPGHLVGKLIDSGGAPQLGASVERATGLDTRAAAEGLASLPLAVADTARAGINALGHGYHALTGQEDFDYLPESYHDTFNRGLSELGLPAPTTRGEQLASAAVRGAASAAGGIGAGQLLQDASSPVVRGVGDVLVSSPGAQTVAGASSGISSEAARQAGFGEKGQLVAGVLGGLGAGLSARNLDASTAEASLPAGAAATTRDAEALRASEPQAEAVAQQGATGIGLHWDALSDELKSRMLLNAEQAQSLGSDLAPEALARKAVYDSLGLKPTRALLTRNFADALNEQNLLTEPEGDALRNIYAQNNQAIREQLQGLKPQGVTSVDAPTFGEQFRAPIEAGERSAQQQANTAYTSALEQEGSNIVNPTQINQFLKDNTGVLNNRTSTAGLIDDLKKNGFLSDTAASPEYTPPNSQVNLKGLANARAAVNEAWQTAKNTGDARAVNRLNELRGLLDNAMDDAGGDLFKAYNKIRGAKSQMYENNPLIDDLISDKRGYIGTNRIEDSQVFDKAVLKSSTEQFQKVWPRLSPEAQDLTRAQMAQYIEDRTFSNMGMNEQGDVVASAAKLSQTLNSINPNKLQTIYGKSVADQVSRLKTAVQEISNPPRGTVPAGSAPKIAYRMNLLMKSIGAVTRIPYLGDAAKAVGNAIERGAESKANEAAVDAAVNPIQSAPSKSGIIERARQTGAPLIAPISGAAEQRQ